jgi:putative ABC transport system ATP-binding protein
MPLIEARDISKTYPLAVEAGEFLVIEGASGSGKTTLLSILSGLDRPSSGRVVFDGRDITDLDEDTLAPLRTTATGFVFQNFHLVPSLTTLENVMLPAELAGDRAARDKALAILERVGLSDRVESYPHQLSGGEKQRTAICRALVNNPRVIFADEPTGNLDSENGASVFTLLLELRREKGATLVLVTHNSEISARADRVVTLRDGRLVSGG